MRLMKKMIAVGLRDPDMRKVALAVAAGDEWTLDQFVAENGYHALTHDPLSQCGSKNEECELENIYRFVKGNIRYTGDISGVDTYVSARRSIFEFRGGDCDDATVALATLLVQNGYSVVARLVAGRGQVDRLGRPVISHIYAVALVPKFSPKTGVALDTTLGDGQLGTEPDRIAQIDFRLY